MDKQIGRRGLLKVVAGAAVAALGANALADKVLAKQPFTIDKEGHLAVSTVERQVKAIKLSPQAKVTTFEAGPFIDESAEQSPWYAYCENFVNEQIAKGNVVISSLPSGPNYFWDYHLREEFPDYDPAWRIVSDEDGGKTLKST